MRSLRPFAFALGWLVLFEALLRLACAPDPRTVRDPEHPYGCFADDALAQLVAAREADARAARTGPPDGPGAAAPPLDVLLIGDSVLASVENAPGQRLVDVLQRELQQASVDAGDAGDAGAVGRRTRVWALAAGGARAADVYAMLRRIERTLAAGRRGTAGVLLVVSSNVIFFSQRHRQPAMAYPCLAGELSELGTDAGTDTATDARTNGKPHAGTDAGLDGAQLRARLAVPGAADSALGRLEHRLLAAATAHIYLLQQRRRLAEWLFGGPPRLALREGLQTLMHRHGHGLGHPPALQSGRAAQSPAAAPAAEDELRFRDRPWTERGLSAAQFAGSYDFVPLDSPDAANLLWTQLLARRLGAQRDLAAVAVLVPQNHALLGALAQGPAYDAVVAAIAAAFTGAGVPFVSFDHDPAIASAHFLDLDHLTAAGNRALAARLAQELAPRLRVLARTAR